MEVSVYNSICIIVLIFSLLSLLVAAYNVYLFFTVSKEYGALVVFAGFSSLFGMLVLTVLEDYKKLFD